MILNERRLSRTLGCIAFVPIYKDLRKKYTFPRRALKRYDYNSAVQVFPVNTTISTDLLVYYRSKLKELLKKLKQIKKEATYHIFKFMEIKIDEAIIANNNKLTKISKYIYHSKLKEQSYILNYYY